MLPEELLWLIALDNTITYRAMVTSIPQLARKITLGTQCDHKIHFGYEVKVVLTPTSYSLSPGIICHPAIRWYLNGKLYRTGGPAIEYANGTKLYYCNNKLHRTDGPAIEYADGSKEYYVDNKLHRTDGHAIEYANGRKDWYLEGNRHRTNGPAIERVNGYKYWYINGKLHRTDGPAIEYADGNKYWYLDGVECSERVTL